MSCSGSSPVDRLAQIGRSTSTRRATVQIRYASTNGIRIYRYVLYLTGCAPSSDLSTNSMGLDVYAWLVSACAP
jgi:hypothetical protein